MKGRGCIMGCCCIIMGWPIPPPIIMGCPAPIMGLPIMGGCPPIMGCGCIPPPIIIGWGLGCMGKWPACMPPLQSADLPCCILGPGGMVEACKVCFCQLGPPVFTDSLGAVHWWSVLRHVTRKTTTSGSVSITLLLCESSPDAGAAYIHTYKSSLEC